MTQFYLDVSAVGNEYQAYADTPSSWGVPQDGNGKAGPGSSPAVAIAVLDCTSAQGDGAQTLSILGVTVNDSSAGSGATLAASLVASINGTTTATSATYCQALLPLNKLVFARQNPGAMAQVQVMMRIAGADWNGISPAHAGFTTGPTITAFSGGADGPFAYFTSPSAIFGVTPGYYGAFSKKSSGTTDPGASDVIHVRAARSGVGLSVTTTSNVDLRPTPASPRNFRIDNLGEIWSGDSGQFKLTFVQTASNSLGVGSSGGAVALRIVATQKDGFWWVFYANAGYSSIYFNYNCTGYFQFERCKFEPGDLTTTLNLAYSATSYRMIYIDCRVIVKKQQTLVSAASNYDFDFYYLGGSIEYSGIGANITSVVSLNAISSPTEIKFEGVNFVVDSGAYSVAAVFSGGSTVTGRARAVLSVLDCVGVLNPSVGLPAVSAYPMGPTYTWVDSKTGTMRFETKGFTSEYNPSVAMPTLGVTNALGALMSQRITWDSSRFTAPRQMEVMRVNTFYKDSQGIKTCELEMLTPSAAVPTSAHIGMKLTYTDKDNILRNEFILDDSLKILLGTASNLPAGVGLASWVMNGFTGYDSRKLSITTAYEVKQNSIISIELLWLAPPASGSYNIYVSPEVRVS